MLHSKLSRLLLLAAGILLPGAAASAFAPEGHNFCMYDVFYHRGYSDAAIKTLVDANRSVDLGQEYWNAPSHFDSETLAEGSALIRRRLESAVAKLAAGDTGAARVEFGKATHAVQDFFSHSNYVETMDGKPIDVLHLRNPPPGTRCDVTATSGALTTGHYPDNKAPAGKCSHAQLNKDVPDKPLFYKALKHAKIHTALLEEEFARQVAARHPGRAPELMARFKDSANPPAPRSQAYRFDVAANVLTEGMPLDTAIAFPGLPVSGIDTALYWNDSTIYFFKRDQYYRFNFRERRVDAGYPSPIAKSWPGLSFTDRVDAAVIIHGKAYMFRGDKYVRYDVATDRQDQGYPQAISAHWPGVFPDGVDEAVRIKNKVYFFKGDSYVRYDIATDRADAGYPKKIAADWPGLPPQIKAAFTGSKHGDDPAKILYVIEPPVARR
jgi:hypothetical protein